MNPDSVENLQERILELELDLDYTTGCIEMAMTYLNAYMLEDVYIQLDRARQRMYR